MRRGVRPSESARKKESGEEGKSICDMKVKGI